MKVLRWGLAALLAVYALLALMPVLFTWSYKLNGQGGGAKPTMLALADAISPPLMTAWTLMAVLYLAGVVVFVVRPGRAWPLLTLAWLLDVGVVLLTQGAVAYQAAFDPAERLFTWVLLLAAAAAIAGVGWIERSPIRRSTVG